MSTRELWVRRLVLTGVLWAVAYVALRLLEFAPLPIPLALVVLAGMAVWWLITDVVADDVGDWSIPVEGMSGGVEARDDRLGLYCRRIESNLTARTPDAGVQDLLRTVTQSRLALRHGLTLADPGVEEMLGARLAKTLVEPPRRIPLAELHDHLNRIESL